MSNRQFFAFTHLFGMKRNEPSQNNVDNRVALVRRLECWTCPEFRTNMFPKDDDGNEIAKHQCNLLDIKNEAIEAENTKRHPSEQIPFFECLYGSLADIIPRTPRNASDYVNH